MITCVAVINRKAAWIFRAVDDDQARAIIDDQEGGIQSDLKVVVAPAGMGSRPFRCERLTPHNMPNGSSLAIRQLQMGKLT